MRARSSIRTANWAAIGSSPLATRPADHSAWALLAAPVALPAGVLSDASNPPICVNEPISAPCTASWPGGRRTARSSTERVALCAFCGWKSLRVKIHSHRSFGAPPIRPRLTNEPAVSGAASCATRRFTSRIPSHWLSSSSGSGASMHVLLGSPGAWGDVGRPGRKDGWHEGDDPLWLEALGWPGALSWRQPHRDGRHQCRTRNARLIALKQKISLFAGHDAGAAKLGLPRINDRDRPAPRLRPPGLWSGNWWRSSRTSRWRSSRPDWQRRRSRSASRRSPGFCII
jgi:hypothetical protein